MVLFGPRNDIYNSGSALSFFFFLVLLIERGQYLHENYIINGFCKKKKEKKKTCGPNRSFWA